MLLCADKTFGQGLLARAGAMARRSLLQYGRMPAFAVRWSQGGSARTLRELQIVKQAAELTALCSCSWWLSSSSVTSLNCLSRCRYLLTCSAAASKSPFAKAALHDKTADLRGDVRRKA